MANLSYSESLEIDWTQSLGHRCLVTVAPWNRGLGGVAIDESDASKAWMLFDASIILYEADTTWVEPTLCEIKDFLVSQKSCPAHTPKGNNYSGCDLGRYLSAVTEVAGTPYVE